MLADDIDTVHVQTHGRSLFVLGVELAVVPLLISVAVVGVEFGCITILVGAVILRGRDHERT